MVGSSGTHVVPAHLRNVQSRRYQMAGGMWPLRDIKTKGGWEHSGVVAITSGPEAEVDVVSNAGTVARLIAG